MLVHPPVSISKAHNDFLTLPTLVEKKRPFVFGKDQQALSQELLKIINCCPNSWEFLVESRGFYQSW